MSNDKADAARLKGQLTDLLKRTPRAEFINSVGKARAFKELHKQATKYAQSSKSDAGKTLSFISQLNLYH